VNLFIHENTILFSQQTSLTVYNLTSKSFDILSPIKSSNQIIGFNNDLNFLLVCHKQFTNMGNRKWAKRPTWAHYGIDETLFCRPPFYGRLKELEPTFIGNPDAEDEDICLPIRLFAR
jgi:hypothetical protein